MEEQSVVASLDFGSGKVTAAVGTLQPNKPGVNVLAGATAPCSGIKGGVVTDIRQASAAIRSAVEKAEKLAGVQATRAYLALRGEHIKSTTKRGRHAIARPDREITREDVEAATQNAQAGSSSEDRATLHVLPQSFTLDGTRVVSDPVGMQGSLLDVEAHIITADAASLDTLEKAVADAGFDAAGSVYGLLAASELILTSTERELGCLLLDIGGELTSFGYFAKDSLVLARELPTGSDTLTRDLAYGLHSSLETAEQLKVAHGLRDTQVLWTDADPPRIRSDRRAPPARKSNLRRHLAPRVKRMFAEVSAGLLASGVGLPLHGAVLTGGGALLKGLDREVAKLLGTQARIGLPQAHPHLVAVPAQLLEPQYVTAVGLLAYASAQAQEAAEPAPEPWFGFDHPLLRRVQALLADIL